MKVKGLVVLILMVAFQAAFAQQMTLEKFGRNRLQYEHFDWRYLSSDNFDVYFYQGGEKIAKDITLYLEGEFDRVTDIIGHPPYAKTKVFLYNSVSDLQQSNVGINDGILTPNGETSFVKPIIEIAHPGDIASLKEELIYKVSSLMVNEMLFGGNLKDMFQSSILLNLPAWFINGASLYVAKGWSIEMDDYIRDLIVSKKNIKLNRLSGESAALAGQSVWNYIAEKYGKSNISNTLNYTRIIRNEERSVEITLGVSFDRLLKDWQQFYLGISQEVSENYKMPSDELIISSTKNRNNTIYNNVKLSPDRSKLAFTEINQGKYSVIVRDIEKNKEVKVISGGYRVIEQDYDRELPLVDWLDDITLGIIYEKKGKPTLVLYDVINKSKLPRVLSKLDQVQSMDFSENGRLIVVSAVVKGKNDLYLLSAKRNRVKRITNDLYDDLDPTFVPGTNTIVFSSNRETDTLTVDKTDFNTIGNNFNLFFYNLDTTKNLLKRLTNTISKDSRPIAKSADKIYYISDQKGIENVFSYTPSSGIYNQVTNYAQSVKGYDIDFINDRMVFVMPKKASDYVYFDQNFNPDNQIFTPATARQQVQQVKIIRQRRNLQKKENLTIKDIIDEKLKQKNDLIDPADSLKEEGVIDTENYTFETEEEEEGIVNTDDYQFESEVVEKESKLSFISQYRQLSSSKNVSGPFPYQERFGADNMVTSPVIDPFRGFGLQLEARMTDILENHKFSGGILASWDLRGGDMFAEYEYLKPFIDFNVRFERSVIEWEVSDSFDFNLHQYARNAILFGASIPINNKARFSFNPHFTTTRFNDLVNNPSGSFKPVQSEEYIGAHTEFVFDNSIINGMNLIEGSRAKVSLEHYEGLSNKDISFSNFKADFRHYQKIHREIVLAGRVFYGSFFGRSPKNYLLGGMDNWLLKRENLEGSNNPLAPVAEGVNNSQLLFTEFATNLRGFDYATIVGNNALVFNAELRIPLIRYLQNGPIASNFFHNLQFTGFFDIGSAWTGKSPFNEENNISNRSINPPGSPFTIDLKNFRNPWLYSYGIGFRTLLLGYYVKLDIAWPVENFIVRDTRLHVTLGYDF